VTFVTFCLTPNSSFGLCTFCVSYSCFLWFSSQSTPTCLGQKAKLLLFVVVAYFLCFLFLFSVVFISSLPQLAWDKRLSCCCLLLLLHILNLCSSHVSLNLRLLIFVYFKSKKKLFHYIEVLIIIISTNSTRVLRRHFY
jgi:hypothetical protein